MEPKTVRPPQRSRAPEMVLDRQRRILDFLLNPMARALPHLNPNYLTAVGLVLAFVASYFFWRSDPATEPDTFALLFASGFVLVHGLLDMLDGVVARTYKKETPLGDFLDHVVDRVSDVFLLSAAAFSPWGDVRVGLFAISVTLIVSYLGTQAQAVGAGRMYSGFVARADRIVLLAAAPLVDHWLAAENTRLDLFPGAPPYALGIALWLIALGGTITALERFARIFIFLRKQGRRQPPAH